MKSSQLEKFLKEYGRFYDVSVIGKSVLGKNIYALKMEADKSFKWALLTAGMHAREHLSCDFLCEFIKQAYKKKLNCNLCFVPLVNPDGADLCIDGMKGLDEDRKKSLLEINGGEDFSLFKANANGVDLNNNWDANWEKKFTHKFAPSSQGFYGYAPMSEPEVKALAKLSKNLNLFLSLSFHLKGEEIYFDFFQDASTYERDEKIAQLFASSSGYKIKSTQNVSSGGFKDFCVQKLKIPALTIELGDDKFSHPYPKSGLENLCKKNANLFENIQKSLQLFEEYQKRQQVQ